MKKLISALLSLILTGFIWAQPAINFPEDMVIGDIEYQVNEAYVCAKNMNEADKIINDYITTYNLRRKITATFKCCNYIDKNINQGVIVKYTLESSALD